MDTRRTLLKLGLTITGCAIGYLVAATVLDRILHGQQ